MTDTPMTLASFLARRAEPTPPTRRPTCSRCWKSLSTCYCHVVKPFTSPIEFVILQHVKESRNTIATARMVHLSMRNSHLLIGSAFAGDVRVEALLAAPGRRNVMLYPRPDAVPLDTVLTESLAPAAEPLVLWVIDAKWAQVPKLLRFSPTVRSLPATAFVPEKPSQFCVRMQPKPTCVSTVEAVHAVLARHAALSGGSVAPYDGMLEVFRHLVRQQLGYCDYETESRHAVAKRKRAERRGDVEPRRGSYAP